MKICNTFMTNRQMIWTWSKGGHLSTITFYKCTFSQTKQEISKQHVQQTISTLSIYNWQTVPFKQYGRIYMNLVNLLMIKCIMNVWITTKFILVQQYKLMSFQMQQINSFCNTLSRFTKFRVRISNIALNNFNKTWVTQISQQGNINSCHFKCNK